MHQDLLSIILIDLVAAVGHCSFPLVWCLLLPLVSGAISLYLLAVFALRACAGVIRGRAFLVDKNLPVSSGSFSLWPLLSELSWMSAMSLSGLLAWNFIHSLCCRITLFHGALHGQPSSSVIWVSEFTTAWLCLQKPSLKTMPWLVRLWIYYVILPCVSDVAYCFIFSPYSLP